MDLFLPLLWMRIFPHLVSTHDKSDCVFFFTRSVEHSNYTCSFHRRQFYLIFMTSMVGFPYIISRLVLSSFQYSTTREVSFDLVPHYLSQHHSGMHCHVLTMDYQSLFVFSKLKAFHIVPPRVLFSCFL